MFQSEGIEALLIERLNVFEQIDKKDLDFVDEFIESSKNNLILIHFLKKNSQNVNIISKFNNLRIYLF